MRAGDIVDDAPQFPPRMYDRKRSEDYNVMHQGLGIYINEPDDSRHAVLRPGILDNNESGYIYKEYVQKNWPYALLFVGVVAFFAQSQ